MRLDRLTSLDQPLGAALIGMHRNATIEWRDEGRIRTLSVIDYGW